MRDAWVAWWAMLLAILLNGVASFVAPRVMWVTVPLALFFVWHYYRVRVRWRD